MSEAVYGAAVNEAAALLVNVTAKNIQDIQAEVLDVYWPQPSFPSLNVGQRVQFIGEGGTWGRVELRVGERAIVFLQRFTHRQGKAYEYCQHIRVEEIEGRWWAADFFDIKRAKGVPSWLLDAAKPYQQGTDYFRVPFDVMERHLRDIAKLSAA